MEAITPELVSQLRASEEWAEQSDPMVVEALDQLQADLKDEKVGQDIAAHTLTELGYTQFNGARQSPLSPTESAEQRPFPKHVWGADFADFVDDVAKARNTHPDAAYFVALQARSALWGPAMDYEFIEGWRKQCGLYSCLLTPTGRGKSRLFSVFMKPVYDLEPEVQAMARPGIDDARQRAEVIQAKKQATLGALKHAAKKGSNTDTLEGDLATYNEELAELEEEQVLPCVWFSSVTNEFAPAVASASGGMLAIVSAETPMLRIAAGAFTSGQASVEALNSGFDGEFVGDGRISRDQVKVRPRLSCAWGSQPEKLKQYAASCPELVHSGFLARFALYIPPDIAGTRCRKLKLFEDSRVQAYTDAGIATALQLREHLPVFKLSAEGVQAYEAWATRWEAEYKAGGKLALLYGFAERIHDIAGRIAALLHVHHYGATEATIPAKTMKDALEVTDWLIAQTGAAYRELGIGQEGELADAIWDWALKKGIKECTLRDLQRNGPGQKKYNAAQHRVALAMLAEEGKVKLTEEDTGRPGRTQVRIRILGGAGH